MKLLLSAFLIIASASAFSADSPYIVDEVFNRDCSLEVLEDVYILHSTKDVHIGYIRLTANYTNTRENRRLPVGRKIKIRKTTKDTIFFADGTLAKMCFFASNNGMCMDVENFMTDEVEAFSEGMLKMVCVDKGTVDA